ncbi:hypothetical protein OAO87_02690 [bacterium]|nr:hypothetical protein [bacterium]
MFIQPAFFHLEVAGLMVRLSRLAPRCGCFVRRPDAPRRRDASAIAHAHVYIHVAARVAATRAVAHAHVHIHVAAHAASSSQRVQTSHDISWPLCVEAL